MRLAAHTWFEKTGRREFGEIIKTLCILREGHDWIGRQGWIIGAGEAELAAENRLHARIHAGLGKLDGTEQIARISDPNGGHRIVAGKRSDFIGFDRPF